GRKPLRGRPGASLPPADLAGTRKKLEKQFGRPVSEREAITHLLYPRVFPEFAAHQAQYSDTSVLPTTAFFYGMEKGAEISVDIEAGKARIVRLLGVGDPHGAGKRLVFFELNGQPRAVLVEDDSLAGDVRAHPKADPEDVKQVSAPMPGLVVNVAVA